jgi:hypothetical protein
LSVAPGPTALPLLTVVDALTDELDQIESIFASCVGGRTVSGFAFPYIPTEDGCLVSLWDAWNRFVRSLLLTCAAGPVMGLSGTTYQPATPRNEATALARIVANKKGTFIKVVMGEPKWFDATAIADLTTVLQVQNATQIVNAITATNVVLGTYVTANPLEEIRACRNFVAHKGKSTTQEIIAHVGSGFADLCTHVRSKRAGVEVFSEWKGGVLAIAATAAQ